MVPEFRADTAQFWSSLLGLVPDIQRLNLDGDCWTGPRADCLAAAVRAAGVHCAKIHDVLVNDIMEPPRGYDKRTQGNAFRMDFASLLFQSSATWLKTDPLTGGLRRFRSGMDGVFVDIATGSRFLREVADCCPNIQIMDGYKSCIAGVNIAECDELWMADLSAWRHFCERSTKLTQFDWLCVPFATRYFEIFGQTPKPQLRKLSMTSANNWNWESHLQQISVAERKELESCGYAATATNALKVLDACPALEELRVEWYVSPTPDRAANMNAELFGDAFYVAAARQCPSLTSIKHKQVRGFANPPRVMITFTDRSMRALAKLRHLETVLLMDVNITGAGIFELVVNHAYETRAARQYDILLSNTTQSLGFYATLKDFLQRILAFDGELPCATHPVTLQFVAHRHKVSSEWSVNELASLRALVAQIRAKHPYVGLRGLLETEDVDTGFSSILAFEFSTRQAQERVWSAYVARGVGQDTRLDDVFERRVVRTSMLGVNEEEFNEEWDEEEDEEDGEDWEDNSDEAMDD